MKSAKPLTPFEPPVPNPLEPLCAGDGPFRPNVAALILRRGKKQTKVLLGERYDSPECWQWPQGGLDRGEAVEAGLLREVFEETGIAELEILHRFPFVLRYRFPQSLFNRFGPYIGQEQHYFLVKPASGQMPDLKKAKDKEFRRLAWRPLARANDSAVWFKRPVYAYVLKETQTLADRLAL